MFKNLNIYKFYGITDDDLKNAVLLLFLLLVLAGGVDGLT